MYDSSPMVEVARTYEIMAKFRPIAPKPSLPPSELPLSLKARPCRTRKRARTAFNPSGKQHHRLLQLLLPPLPPKINVPPMEQDLLNKLQQRPKIVVPRPVRPVSSCIRVVNGSISVTVQSQSPIKKQSLKEVEEEVESEVLPAVVSDCNNKVRLANSAYKEMVGQPECMWLDSVVVGGGGSGLKRRINGEVVLAISENIPTMGFPCRVKVEWTACNGKRCFVDAPCGVVRAFCDSNGSLLTWRINTAQAFETNA